jgi:hypothetical protein
MNAGPTNRGFTVLDVDADPAQEVRRLMVEQHGCVCPGGPTIEQAEVGEAERADAEAQGCVSATRLIVKHMYGCPALARSATN